MNTGHVAESAAINEDVKKVWKFITDPENFPKYVNGYADGKVLTENETGLGSAFEWFGRLGPLKLKSSEEVVEWKENERVAYAGRMFGVKFNSSMAVKSTGKQKTTLTVAIRYSVPALLGGKITDRLLLKRMTRDYVKKSIEKIERIFGT